MFRPEQYEVLVRDVLDGFAQSMSVAEQGATSYGDARTHIDRMISNFTGFWKILYEEVLRKLGTEAAKDLQEAALVHAAKLERKNPNSFFAAVKYIVGHNVTLEEYNDIITSAGLEPIT